MRGSEKIYKARSKFQFVGCTYIKARRRYGKYRGDDEVGKLMHDFSCTDPDDMNYEILAKKARYFKQDEKGVATMCKLMEDMRNEAAHEAAHDKVKEKAILMLKNGKISFDEISVFFSELSDEEIEEIKSKIMQLA